MISISKFDWQRVAIGAIGVAAVLIGWGCASVPAPNEQMAEKHESARWLAEQAQVDAELAISKTKAQNEVGDREMMRLDVEADTAQRSAAESKLTAEPALVASAASQPQARSRDLEAQLKELDIRKTERGLVITLGDVLFDTNKPDLKADGLRNVQKLAGVLKEFPQRKVLIEGFTDSIGTSGYNQELSDRRAVAVRTALQATGVGPERISDRGYGQTFPVASNATAEGRQLNRRVDIIVSEDARRIPQR